MILKSGSALDVVRFSLEETMIPNDKMDNFSTEEFAEKLHRTNNLHANRRPSALKLTLPNPHHPSIDKSENGDMKPWMESQMAKSSLLSVLSSLYALVLVILSLAFEVSGLVNDDVNSSRYDMFYIYLYLMGLVFFAYCYFFLMRTKGWNIYLPFAKKITAERNSSSETPSAEPFKLPPNLHHLDIPLLSAKRKVTHSGKNAGSFYLRLGAILFGIVGLIDRALQIYQAVDSGRVPECYDGLNIFEDIVAMIFIFVQLYFIFQNAKLTIHRFKEVGRFGTMHLIAANVCTWIRAVVVEEYHIIHEIRATLLHQGISGKLNHSDSHHLPQNSHDIIVPLLANLSDDIDVGHIDHCLLSHDVADELIRHAKPFMTTCLIEYALICAAVSYIMWRNIGNSVRKRSKFRKQNFQIDCGSSTKGLFVGLFFVVITLVSMVIFFTKVRLERNKEALWVFYFSDCALYVASIIALSVASYKMRNLYYMAHHKGLLLDDILLIIALVGQLMFCIFSIIALTKWELTSGMIVVVSLCRMIEVLMQTVFILVAQRLVASTPEMQAKKPGREMITFLLLANLAMFLINTFETQKAGANPLTMDFYGQSIWTVIVHSTAPLSIFYRFHSSVCLAEIWKTVYRVKEHELL